MAKFCGNCGAPLDDDARVCGQCGTPVDGQKVKDPAKKKKLIKRIKVLIALLIIAAIAGIGAKIALSFTGTNGLVRKVMAAYEKYDIDTMVSLSSDMYYYTDYDAYADEYFENAVGKNIDSFESSVGHSYKMSYEIEEIYKLSERKQGEMLKEINYYYPDFDSELISKISVASIKVTAKQGSKSVSKNVKITMAKEGKTWKVLYLE